MSPGRERDMGGREKGKEAERERGKVCERMAHHVQLARVQAGRPIVRQRPQLDVLVIADGHQEVGDGGVEAHGTGER